MSPRPPAWAEWMVRRAHRHDPALSAILGDLLEDFQRLAARDGVRRARLWYAREALSLALGHWARSPLRASKGVLALGRAGLGQDVLYALRSMRRSPGFSLTVAAVIGLGVGATTTVFSVMSPLMIAPLPFEDAHRLVWLQNGTEGDEGDLSAVTSRTSNLVDFRERVTALEGLAGINAFSGQSAYTLEGDGAPERLVGYEVTPDLLDVLGVEPLLGRDFVTDDATYSLGHGSASGILLAHGFWVRRFGADPSVVGRTLVLDGRATEVLGVLPASFDFGSVFTPAEQVDFLAAMPVTPATDSWGNTLHMVGRLRPGATVEQAQSELDAVLAGLREAQPDRWGLGGHITPLREKLAAPFRSGLVLLAAAASTLLLIVCVNVSNMLLARAPGRAREIAVRKAMGASRARLVRQHLLEAVGLAAVGSALGAVLAWGGTSFVSARAAVRLPLLDHIGLDATALAFAVGVAFLTGLAVGLLPALQVREGGEATILRSGGRTASSGRAARRTREALVVSEVALASVLLVLGGLLLRSFHQVMDVDLGFDPSGVVAWQLDPVGDFASNAELVAWFDAVAARVGEVPGVSAVGFVDALPLGRNRSWDFSVVGAEATAADEPLGMYPHIVGGAYFAALDIGLVEGRVFAPDEPSGGRTVVINQSAATRFFGSGRSALGRQIRLWMPEPWDIVGVVEDVRHVSPEAGPGVQVYFPMTQIGDYASMEMAVRATRPPPDVVPAARAALSAADPSIATGGFWTMDDRLSRALSARRFLLQVLGAFGAAALMLAGFGIYGVLSFTVAERRSEIGIRMALGATRTSVLGAVMGRTATLAGLGVGLGILGSVLGARVVGSLLYGVEALDPVAIASSVALLLGVAALSGVAPAFRAARTDGVRALQAE